MQSPESDFYCGGIGGCQDTTAGDTDYQEDLSTAISFKLTRLSPPVIGDFTHTCFPHRFFGELLNPSKYKYIQ